MKKTHTTALVLVLLIVSLLVTSVALASKEDRLQGRVTISIWQHSYPPLNLWTQKVIEEFMEIHPNITVEYELVPFEEWNQKIFTALATMQGPNFFEADDYTFAQFVQNRSLAPLDPTVFGYDSVEAMSADFEGNSLNLVTFDGVLYGLPYDWESPVLGYSVPIFEEVGLDATNLSTWDMAMEAAEKAALHDDRGLLTRAGFCFVHNIDVYYQLQGTTLVNQAGASVLNEDQTAATINVPEAVQVFQLWKDVIHKYEADTPGFSSTFYTEEFSKGNVAMGFMLTWANSILEQYGLEYAKDYNMAPLPTFTGGSDMSISYAWNWVLNSANTEQENIASMMLMDYMSQQGDTYIVDAGLINPRKGWQDRVSQDVMDKFTVIQASLDKSKPIQPHVKFNEIWSAVQRVFQTVAIDADADIEVLLENAEQEINRVLR